ncbi:hypothetical protein D3C76_1415450 [compost metagenome]
MAGGDVDANMKRRFELRRQRCQQVHGLLHQRPGHRYDQAAVFGEWNEQVRANEAFLGVVPAHQHFDAGPAFAVAVYDRLQIGHELAGFQGPLQFTTGRGGAFLQPVPEGPGHDAEEDQQAEQRRIFSGHVTPGLALVEAGFYIEGVAR